MPRNPRTEPGTEVVAPLPAGTLALDSMPDDVRADLLREQAESLEGIQKLPRMKILPAGAGYFEYEDTPGTTFREFEAVILGHHKRNVLWDRRFGDGQNIPEDQQGPACSSPDGIHGVPRAGFRHAGLPNNAVADGFTQVACATCPYNQWGTGQMLIPTGNARGKAVTNQRSLYLMTEGRSIPTELVLPPTSLPSFDEYSVSMMNRQFPLVAILTKLKQEVSRRGGVAWGVVKFEFVRQLTTEEFAAALDKKNTFRMAMTTTAQQQIHAEMARAASSTPVPDTEETDDDAPPF